MSKLVLTYLSFIMGTRRSFGRNISAFHAKKEGADAEGLKLSFAAFHNPSPAVVLKNTKPCDVSKMFDRHK
jgi:hypothetical protein